MGSIPEHSELFFSGEPAILMFVWCQHTRTFSLNRGKTFATMILTAEIGKAFRQQHFLASTDVVTNWSKNLFSLNL